MLLWEDFWPPLAFACAVALVFVAASWLGVWLFLPPWVRLATLALLGIAFTATLTPLLRIRWPDWSRALDRLDRDAGVAHRPVSSLDDELSNFNDDPATQVLWALHKERMAEQLKRLAVKPPSPRLPLRDPYALRFLAILLALIGFFAAGAERVSRLSLAFSGMPELAHAAGARVDAWIDPPNYTGKPPIFLKLAESGASRELRVPEDSVLVVRADSDTINTSVTGGLTATASTSKQEVRYALRADGEAKIYRDGNLVGDIKIKVQLKTLPSIRLLDPPQANASGSLTLHYAIDDDYGIRRADSIVTALNRSSPGRSLFGPPQIELALPGAANGVGENRTTVDLSEHPWAGAHVMLNLTTASVSGATASSPPIDIILPQKRFVNPLAKALVELRRDLVLDPDRNASRVAVALKALQTGPEFFGLSPRVYLDLRGVSQLLANARGDDDLRSVSTWLWTLALSIENGDASQALKDLRALADKLRKALHNGASPDELKKITEELRAAMERYIAEMSRNANKQAMQSFDTQDAEDLNAMLDQLQKDAAAGAKDEAQNTLDKLQDMMENLRSAENQKSDPVTNQLRQSLRDLETLLKDQQALRDDTFRQDQRERSGAAPADRESKDQQLHDRQATLKDRLEEIERRLRGAGVDPPKNLGEAQNNMSDAERSLRGDVVEHHFGPSPKSDATESQGKAIEALRKGGQQMAKQMRGRGKGRDRFVGIGQGSESERNDPLGRGRDGAKGAAVGALNGGPDSAERARRVLEELRRRLSDPGRPAEERKYLERLIGQP